MSGITGFAGLKSDFTSEKGKWTAVLNDMQKSIIHRGNMYLEAQIKEKICFASNSDEILSDSGKNSMEFYINGKYYFIVLDGEIYNFDELKKELENDKYTFEKNNDSEIVLFLFLKYGIEFVNKINGIFSIALFDGDNFYLFRDRLGIKPIFYSFKDDILIFGSEIKSILKFPNFEIIVDKEGLSEIFALGPAHTQGLGIFKDINEVLPGNYINLSENGLRQKEYWRFESRKHIDSYSETVQKVRDLVLNSVEIQMSKNISSLLSGGLDSSIVTAIANKSHLEKYGIGIETFSFDFTGNSKYFKSNSFQPEQDRPWVDKMVNFLNTKHHYLEANIDDIADNLYNAVDARDYPGMADIDSSLLFFCKNISNSSKVAFSGECADEIFGGYPWFHKKEMFETDSFPWSSNIEIRKSILNPDLTQILNIEKKSNERYRDALAQVPILESESETEKRRRELAFLNLKFFMMTLVDRMDRMSMHSGLTVRVPYADFRIAEYLFNIPWEMKAKDNVTKSLLRKACEGIIPDELLYRKKSPYPKTYNPAYENLLKERLKDIIENNNSPILPLINKAEIEKLINSPSDPGKPWYGQLMAKPQLLAYLLQMNYWLDKYKINIKLS